VLFSLGLARLRRGDLARAIQALERSLEGCRTWQLVSEMQVAATLGVAYALSGRVEEALVLIAGAVERGDRHRLTWWTVALLGAATTCLSAQRTDEAASYAREALAVARRTGARGNEADALCLAGDVASAAGAADAEGHYREALALATELGMRPLVAHCHFGLGKLYQRTGKRERAQEHLTTATTMYGEMGMTYWLKKAEAEVGESA
jgi:tetratricopeptide (TPR) repeat protein